MSLSDPELLEIATNYRQRLMTLRLESYREIAALAEPIIAIARQIHKTRRRLLRAASKQRLTVANKAARELFQHSRSLLCDVSALNGSCNKAHADRIPSATELIAELRHIGREFGSIRYDRLNKVLAAVTETIVLEEVNLGDFEIRLLLAGDPHDNPHRIVALHPNPAAGNDSVTHPHVQDECLCAGDASAPIRKALIQGRLCDFFLLVQSVLTHYNSASPYAKLSEWEGQECYDCGSRVTSDDSFECSSCEHEFCDECISHCWRCHAARCQECLEECPACEERFCSDCIMRCPNCQKVICKSCLVENRCPCKQPKENEHEPESEPATAAEAAAD